jgi:hypothetical protein
VGHGLRVVAVDWSGRQVGEGRAIWLAEARDGNAERLECGRTRVEVAHHLIELAREDPALAVGFDFSFSLPAWFCSDHGLTSADALWHEATRVGEAWLTECAPPFWGRTGRPRPELPEHFRRTETSLPPIGGTRVKSTFQVGGAGSVGTGSIRGFPILARLRAAGFRIWPFHDDPRLPVAVEIYPRLFTGAVVKSRPEARHDYLDEHAPELAEPFRVLATASEDAFDALVAARAMSRHAGELATLPTVDDPVARLEGLVWVPVEQARQTQTAQTQTAQTQGEGGRRATDCSAAV